MYATVDLGATNVRTALGTKEGLIDGSVRKEKRVKVESPNDIFEQIIKLVNKSRGDVSLDEVISLGVGSPGPLEDGCIKGGSNFGDYKGAIPIKDPLEKEFEVPVSMDNDANSAANGELYFGVGKEGYKNIISVTISTGIGCGAVVDGQVRRGTTGNFLEGGHIPLMLDSFRPEGEYARCGSGHDFCWESLASGSGMARRVTYYTKERGMWTSILNIWLDELRIGKLVTNYKEAQKLGVVVDEDSGALSLDGNLLGAKHIYRAYEEEDGLAKKLVHEAQDATLAGMSALMINFDPEFISVYGSLATKDSHLVLEPVIEELKGNRRYSFDCYQTKIQLSPLGDDIGLYGGLANAIEANQ